MRHPPSPSAATVSRSGRATAAPTAVASPRPTDWKAWVKQKPAAAGAAREGAGGPMKVAGEGAGVADEVAGGGRGGGVGGQQRVEPRREHARVDAGLGGGVVDGQRRPP